MKVLSILAILSVLSLACGPAGEFSPGHEDHADGAESHRHGDADDRHDGPDSPCDHQEAHAGCSQAPVAPPVETSDPQLPFVSGFAADTDSRPELDRSTDVLPHVPKA